MKQYWEYGQALRVMNRLPQIMLVLLIAVFCLLAGNSLQAARKAPLRIMPLGDSITAGYTDNPKWRHPFEFGYRSGLYKRMRKVRYNFVFVGESKEPFNKRFGDPTHGGSVRPKLDLRKVKQDGHRGYGAWNTVGIQKHVAQWIKQDRPDIILLLIGINGINNPNSPKQLDNLVKTIYNADNMPKKGTLSSRLTSINTF